MLVAEFSRSDRKLNYRCRQNFKHICPWLVSRHTSKLLCI